MSTRGIKLSMRRNHRRGFAVDQMRILETECWILPHKRHRSGYVYLLIDGKTRLAHRWFYELAKGFVPQGLTLDHLCRNRACVNPAHLEPVSMQENVLRGVGPTAANARKTHCPKGHPLSGENLFRYKDGRRECLACHRERGRENQRLCRARRREGLCTPMPPS